MPSAITSRGQKLAVEDLVNSSSRCINLMASSMGISMEEIQQEQFSKMLDSQLQYKGHEFKWI